MSKGNYIKRISRELYNECITNTDAVKAISMLIYIKENNKASVITNFTYKKLSEMTKLSVVVIKKRMDKLKSMGLCEYTDNKRNIKFLKIRAPKSNVRLDKIDMTSIKSIEIGLRALYIVEVQRRKEYVRSAVNVTGNIHNEKEYENARIIRDKALRGTEGYTDNGISYNYLSTKMNVSKKTISEAIKYGVKHNMFEKKREFLIIKTFLTYSEVVSAYHHFKDQHARLRLVGLSLGLILANTYILI